MKNHELTEEEFEFLKSLDLDEVDSVLFPNKDDVNKSYVYQIDFEDLANLRSSKTRLESLDRRIKNTVGGYYYYTYLGEY